MAERSFEPGEFYLSAGVGPHPQPWPTGPEYDLELLAAGDRRNVADEFRYLTVEAIKERISKRRLSLELAVENWQHDLNLGSMVRTANAFNLSRVHIIGDKHWNQRGALGTYHYIDIVQHESVEAFAQSCQSRNVPVLGFEQFETATPLESTQLPNPCVLLFGNEGMGLTPAAIEACDQLIEIPQAGSVRSINASACAAIAMYAWRLQHFRAS